MNLSSPTSCVDIWKFTANIWHYISPSITWFDMFCGIYIQYTTLAMPIWSTQSPACQYPCCSSGWNSSQNTPLHGAMISSLNLWSVCACLYSICMPSLCSRCNSWELLFNTTSLLLKWTSFTASFLLNNAVHCLQRHEAVSCKFILSIPVRWHWLLFSCFWIKIQSFN